jgi:hypothetical protein
VAFCPVVVTTNAGGDVIVIVAVEMQLFASLTVTVYEPAERLTALDPLCAGVVFQE